MQGSYFAVLADATHRVGSANFESHQKFKEWMRLSTASFRFVVERFTFAWGVECQTYTPAEFLEVFHGE